MQVTCPAKLDLAYVQEERSDMFDTAQTRARGHGGCGGAVACWRRRGFRGWKETVEPVQSTPAEGSATFSLSGRLPSLRYA